LKRLWDAYENLGKLTGAGGLAQDEALETKITTLITQFDEYMNDDFATARVMANMFELAPVINSLKDKTIPMSAISQKTFERLQAIFKTWVEDILGLKSVNEADGEKLKGVMQLLVDIRKEAKTKKDFVTSDKIRNQLSQLGILLNDEKDGSISWSIE
jgi:cysteinyl-tRNA synthetase